MYDILAKYINKRFKEDGIDALKLFSLELKKLKNTDFNAKRLVRCAFAWYNIIGVLCTPMKSDYVINTF